VTWAWASSLDQLWRTPSLMLWIVLAAAGVFTVILFVIVFRAEKSVANAVLAVITLLAMGLAVATNLRGPDGGRGARPAERSVALPSMSVAATSCLDGLAGDAVETACERPLFASADSAAAAVSYTAAQISRLAGFAGQAKADKVTSPEFSSLRRAVERDRFGLVAHVLSARDGCTPTDCAFFASLTEHNQISANMTEHTYEGLIGRYALGWNAPGAAAAAPASVAPAASVPTGKPVSGDFPSSSSIPPVNIMTTEPGGAPAAASPASKPVAAAAPHPPSAASAAKKPAPKKPPAPAPVPLAPPPGSDDNN
jgi:hypothetical protein